MNVIVPRRVLQSVPSEPDWKGNIHGQVYTEEGHLHVAAICPQGMSAQVQIPQIGLCTVSASSSTAAKAATRDPGLQLLLSLHQRRVRAYLNGTDVTTGIQIIDDTAGLDERIRQRIDTDHLRNCRVALFGAGRVGSTVAEHLARSHVGHITLLDTDVVATHNIPHTSFSTSDIGRPKVFAQRAQILGINPLTDVKIFQVDLLSLDENVLSDIIRNHDLLFVAVDEPSFQLRLNDRAYSSTSVVYLALLGGSSGEIVHTAPGTRCLRCCTNIERRRRLDGASAMGAETLPAISLAVQVTLGILLKGKRGGEHFSDLLNEERNLILVGSRQDPVVGSLPQSARFAAVSVDTSRRTRSCDVCGRNV